MIRRSSTRSSPPNWPRNRAVRPVPSDDPVGRDPRPGRGRCRQMSGPRVARAGRPMLSSRVRPPDPLARLGRGPDRALDTGWYALPNQVGLPVVGALVHDATTGYQPIGWAAPPTPPTPESTPR